MRLNIPRLEVIISAALLITAGAVFYGKNHAFLSYSHLEAMIRRIQPYLLLAVGQTVVILTGGIDLSQAAIVVCCSYLGGVMAQHYGIGTLASMALLGLLLGLANGVAVARTRIPAFVVTFATMWICTGVVLQKTGGTPISKTEMCPAFQELLESVGASVSCILVVILVATLWLLVALTAWGRYLRAVGGNERAATLLRVPIRMTKVSAYAVSGFFASAAAFTEAVKTMQCTTLASEELLFFSIAAVLIGGTSIAGGQGGIGGTILGAVLIVMLKSGFILMKLSTYSGYIALGIGLLVFSLLSTSGRKALNLIRQRRLGSSIKCDT